ncbi:MAG: antibiotic biosynthesis monooxygenase [Taibaiella sp.]|nr:antibiotic biosynthesis monooxygenase [Taibaiella sp.]
MIVRIVKMTFLPEAINDFTKLFEERKQQIRHFEGCRHLELWQDAHEQNVFFTYSHWESEAHLDHYRFSNFFKDTWARTKALFSDKPLAWSVAQKVIVI